MINPRLFAKLVMMSSAPEKSAEDARYTSQDPFIDQSTELSFCVERKYSDLLILIICIINLPRIMLVCICLQKLYYMYIYLR